MNSVPLFVKIIISIPDEWLAEKIALRANFRYTLIKIENLPHFTRNENFEITDIWQHYQNSPIGGFRRVDNYQCIYHYLQ
jgi:hypothetical protein